MPTSSRFQDSVNPRIILPKKLPVDVRDWPPVIPSGVTTVVGCLPMAVEAKKDDW